MIVIANKRCKREEIVDTALEMEKNQDVPEAEVSWPNQAKGSILSTKKIISEYDWRNFASVDEQFLFLCKLEDEAKENK